MIQHVRFKGRLQNAGRESFCGGWCTMISHEEDGDPARKGAYADYRIGDESVVPSLPDGEYQLSVHDRIMPATRRNGRWLPVG